MLCVMPYGVQQQIMTANVGFPLIFPLFVQTYAAKILRAWLWRNKGCQNINPYTSKWNTPLCFYLLEIVFFPW